MMFKEKTKPARPRRASGKEDGFTLVELLVVLAIIALIATLATPQILRYLDSARVDTARAQIRNIASALELYYLDNGNYPATEEGLGALAVAPSSANRWNGPYLKGADGLQDPWGTSYVYENTGAAFAVRSLGRDKKTGGEGIDADLVSD
ncbi:type II secretion system major pseudopilin GspG [Nitratireductor sp. ZSWI3]|uniref:type II secretion system major pseudopilin GspG n=1 Tax=Nitratireductor sp. ZSWI3 TaxID=2966359 RepID=UPI00215068EB|nr:type II secretion system major pseudopilin GspG [Nitratireductor sp. ZSWI3]MCR4265783.1 type II secretion system major pseudopilin GspG [Nitratireductor sp. ZSWI3]